MKRPLGLSVVLVPLALLAQGRFGHAGPTEHYVVSNGTVLDTQTGLVWQQVLSGSTYTWNDAQSYCAALSSNGAGWRVPSIKELTTLVNFSASKLPLIDTRAFPNTPGKVFWSSSLWGQSDALYVNFANGNSYAESVDRPTDLHLVRCVR